MQTRHIDRERYFNELASTSREFYIDYLKRFKNIDSNTRILEIGCGEGGNLLPFAESGCTVAGLDLASGKIENAGKFFASRNVKGEFACANFLTDNPFAEDGGFDIILIHDVIEHIEPDGKEAFFLRCKNYLKPDGIVFFGFPAWQMPFGGHQQICRSRVCSTIPFMHVLPAPVYKAWLKMFGEEPAKIDELLSIKRSRMTPELFESYAIRPDMWSMTGFSGSSPLITRRSSDCARDGSAPCWHIFRMCATGSPPPASISSSPSSATLESKEFSAADRAGLTG